MLYCKPGLAASTLMRIILPSALCVWAVAKWIAFASTVAQTEVEEAVRPKRELSSLVV